MFYTVLGDRTAQKTSGQALQRAAGFMRRQIGQRLRLRRAPELHFEYDGGVGHQDRVEQLLKEIADEREQRAADPGEPDTDATDRHKP